MVLADPERVDAELIGEHGLIHHFPNCAGTGSLRAVRLQRNITERIQTELNGHGPSLCLCVCMYDERDGPFHHSLRPRKGVGQGRRSVVP
ncbi:hypothetical protein GCM10027414_16350 [Humibacter ginsengiterrae]